MIDPATLPPAVLAWGSAQAPAVALAPLAKLPPADAGIVAALAPQEEHAGRRWHLCGALGGVMRKAGFARDTCEAVIREWLADAGPDVDVAHGVKHALGAWQKPASDVSGEAALADVVGAEHAAVIVAAVIAARRPARLAPPADADPWHAPDHEAPDGIALELDRTRQGTPRPTQINVARVLESVFGSRIRYEECAGRIVCEGIDPSLGRFPDGEWTDAHTTALLIVCDGLGLNVSPAMADRAVEHHAQLDAYNALANALVQWAGQWDGVPRIDTALSTYWNAADTPATRAVSRVFFLSLAARGIEPGCVVQTCPVFVGAQGLGKSRALTALVGSAWFSDSPLPIGDKDGMQNLRGTWLWEFSENASLGRREMNAVKAFLSSSVDKFRASYGRHAQTVPRQTCFVASTNDVETLTDPTGNRRFLPVVVGEVDVEGVARDREQLLGEAAFRVGELGEQYHPTDAEKVVLRIATAAHEELDPWEDMIAAWLEKRDAKPDAGPFAVGDVFAAFGGAVPMAEAQIGKREQGRAAAILRRLGYERGAQVRRGGRVVRLWARIADT